MKAPVTQCRILSINKHLFLSLFFFVSLVPCLHAQSIGINSSPANNSASLDIGATTLTPKLGLLIPRVTLADRTAMNPLNQAAQGLMVYQTNMVEGFYYNTSTTTTPNWLYLLPASTGSNTFYGYQAANANPSGYQNTGFGYRTFFVGTSGIQNTSIGSGTLYSNTTGSFNTASGFEGLYSNINGQYNTSDGFQALYLNTSGVGNTGIGTGTLFTNMTGGYNTAIGYNANVGSGGLTNATAIGANAMVNTSNSLVLGDAVNVGIGTSSPSAKLEIAGQIKITGGSPGVGKLLMSDAGGLASWSNSAAAWSLLGNAGTNHYTNFIGTTDPAALVFKIDNQQAGFIDFDINGPSVEPTGNTGFGFRTLISNDYDYNFGTLLGVANTAVGCKALTANYIGSYNTGYGYKALSSCYNGFNNTAVGAGALSISSESYHNTAIGVCALGKNTTGSGNTASGSGFMYNGSIIFPGQAGSALGSNTTGNYNTADGMGALYSNTTGSQNTALGYRADVGSVDLMNATAIGAYAIVGASNSLVLGGTGTNTVNVGIGITIPQEKLDVIGNIRSSTLAPNGIKMVQADNNGTLIQLAPGSALQVLLGSGVWGSVPGIGNYWSITGNTGTVDNSNFIGTTDNIPFNIKVNNQKAGRIDHLLFNTFFGYMAGNVNTGNWNTAIGNIALRDNTTGHDNTATGDETLTFNTSGYANTANGEGSLFRNTTGSNNSANGYASLAFNTTGNSNVAMGVNALYKNSTTGNLVAIGDSALYNNGTGAVGKDATENTALGSKALYANTTGSNNTAGGFHTLINNTTGAWNTAIGDMALKQNTMGDKNTAMGYGADVGANNLVNATAIGYNAIVATSNSMVLGATGADVINVAIGYTSPLSRLDVNGAIGTTIKKITVNTTLDNTAAVWYASPLPLSPMTLTLPSAGTVTNRRYVVVNRSAATVNISGYTNLSGISTTTISANSSIEIISDGTDWLQIK